MKFLITERQYKLLKENTTVPSNVQSAYNQIVTAVNVWYGTDKSDKTGVLNALNLIKNTDELKQLFSLFKDKKTGYSSFDEMVNEEFDRSDINYVTKIKNKLISFPNVTCYFDTFRNGLNQQLFNEGFRTVFIGPETKYDTDEYFNRTFEQRSSEAFDNAKKWWINYLNSPTFLKKFKTNWGFSDSKANEYIKKYLNLINILPRLQYYDNSTKFGKMNTSNSGANAFVPEGGIGIYINKSSLGMEDEGRIKLTLIHEIQHLLQDIHPLNPDEKVNKAFGVSDGYPNASVKSSRLYTKILSLKNELSITEKKATGIVNDLNGKWSNYICSEDENVSRLANFRAHLGITNRDLTIDDVKYYVPRMSTFKFNNNFIFMLKCWLIGDVPSLSQFISNLNTLAKKETPNTSGSNKEMMA